MLQDVFEPGDQAGLGQIRFDPNLLVVVGAEQDEARFDVAEVAAADVTAQFEAADRAEGDLAFLAGTLREPELGQDEMCIRDRSG